MKRPNRILAACAAAFLMSAAGLAALPAADCVPEGTTKDIEFPTSLVVAGMPTNPTLRNFQAVEHDPFSNDMVAGASGTVNGDVLTCRVPITNTGGKLRASDGESLNDGSEGDCIELFVRFQVLSPATRCHQVAQALTVGGAGQTTVVEECTSVWVSHGTWRTTRKVVCPC